MWFLQCIYCNQWQIAKKLILLYSPYLFEVNVICFTNNTQFTSRPNLQYSNCDSCVDLSSFDQFIVMWMLFFNEKSEIDACVYNHSMSSKLDVTFNVIYWVTEQIWFLGVNVKSFVLFTRACIVNQRRNPLVWAQKSL
jgi:hypothetical protein